MNHHKVLLIAFGFLLAGIIVCLGYHDTSHDSIVWVKHRPSLYTPIFYNADSLHRYIDIAFHEDDAEALCIAGTAAYNLRVFDQAALDSLPAVPLEDADVMLLRAASLKYVPAFTVIHYLDRLNLWHHSIPECPASLNTPIETPSPDPDYQTMKIKK